MWFLFVIVFIFFAYLVVATTYFIFLAFVYFFVKEKDSGETYPFNKFVIFIPAHNEEMLVANTIESLLKVDYPSDKYEIAVIDSNCSNNTVVFCNRYLIWIALTARVKLLRNLGVFWAVRSTRCSLKPFLARNVLPGNASKAIIAKHYVS